MQEIYQLQREMSNQGKAKGLVYAARDLFKAHLELVELLLVSSWGLGVLDDVESDGLGERSALTNGDDIAEFNVPEAGREVDSHVLNAAVSKIEQKCG